jgi:hypothetical protein
MLANVIFTQEVKHQSSDARLEWHTATTLRPGIADTNLWWYIVGVERLARMNDGGGV